MNTNTPLLRPRRRLHFTEVGEYRAYIAVTQFMADEIPTSACAFNVISSDDKVFRPEPLTSSRDGTTAFRAGIAALRGAVESVAGGSSIIVFTDSEPLKNAFENKSGRKEQVDLWDHLDTLIAETGTKLSVQPAKGGDPHLKDLKLYLTKWRKSR